MLYWIGLFCLYCFSLFSTEHVYLKTPTLLREDIIGTTVGIRPYRKTGVRLEAEVLQDKLIIHNYGYGGYGLTLSFGGAFEVLEILRCQKVEPKIVAVLGAGVVGLATAYDLLEKSYEVHLYANEWSPKLTSNVAAGIWTPPTFPSEIPEEKKRLQQRMLETSKQRFLQSLGDQPEFAGVRLICCYSFKSTSTNLRGERVTVHFDNGIIKEGGRKIYELGIDGGLFMEDLYSKVKEKGAILEQKHFENLEDILNLNEPVIVNCLSIGSRELFDDPEFIPVRGQMIYFKPQEGVDYLFFQNVPNSLSKWVSIYPWSDRLILGGIYEYGEKELITNPEILDEMIQNAEKCLSGNL